MFFCPIPNVGWDVDSPCSGVYTEVYWPKQERTKQKRDNKALDISYRVIETTNPWTNNRAHTYLWYHDRETVVMICIKGNVNAQSTKWLPHRIQKTREA